MTAGIYFKLDHYFFFCVLAVMAFVLIVLVMTAVLLMFIRDKQGTSLMTIAC